MITKYIEIVFNNGSSRTYAKDEVEWEYTPNTFYVALGHISYAIPYTSIKEIIFKERDVDVSAITNNNKALEQEPILDKIRAEIEKLKPNNPYFKGYFEQNVALNKALEVIDKYTAESEE